MSTRARGGGGGADRCGCGCGSSWRSGESLHWLDTPGSRRYVQHGWWKSDGRRRGKLQPRQSKARRGGSSLAHSHVVHERHGMALHLPTIYIHYSTIHNADTCHRMARCAAATRLPAPRHASQPCTYDTMLDETTTHATSLRRKGRLAHRVCPRCRWLPTVRHHLSPTLELPRLLGRVDRCTGTCAPLVSVAEWPDGHPSHPPPSQPLEQRQQGACSHYRAPEHAASPSGRVCDAAPGPGYRPPCFPPRLPARRTTPRFDFFFFLYFPFP